MALPLVFGSLILLSTGTITVAEYPAHAAGGKTSRPIHPSKTNSAEPWPAAVWETPCSGAAASGASSQA